MTLDIELQAVRDRNEGVQRVRSVLANFPSGTQRAIVLDVLAGLDGHAVLSVPIVPSESSDDGPVAKLRTALKGARSGILIDEAAVALYGICDTKNRNRVRSLLTSLKKRGEAEMLSRGRWRWMDARVAPDTAPTVSAESIATIVLRVVSDTDDHLSAAEVQRRARKVRDINPQSINAMLHTLATDGQIVKRKVGNRNVYTRLATALSQEEKFDTRKRAPSRESKAANG